jgi:hypothetical protein
LTTWKFVTSLTLYDIIWGVGWAVSEVRVFRNWRQTFSKVNKVPGSLAKPIQINVLMVARPQNLNEREENCVSTQVHTVRLYAVGPWSPQVFSFSYSINWRENIQKNALYWTCTDIFLLSLFLNSRT